VRTRRLAGASITKPCWDRADPVDKAALYGDLCLRLTYQPSERTVLAEAHPVYVARVGGAFTPERTRALLRGELPLAR
jgi:hypothetical protein